MTCYWGEGCLRFFEDNVLLYDRAKSTSALAVIEDLDDGGYGNGTLRPKPSRLQRSISSGFAHLIYKKHLIFIGPQLALIGMARSVRVEDRTYRKLAQTAGRLQSVLGHQVSLDDAIWFLLKAPREENRITDLAGSWKMSDEEAKELERELREHWRRWKIPRSV